MNNYLKLALLASAITMGSVTAEAHRQWLLPSATVLSGTDAWVTVDGAVSNDLFHFEHFPLQLDGLSVLRRWRAAGRAMPVLILTARDSWTEKVAGLDAGADDYLAKPFAMAELLARLRALVRRAHGRAQPEIQLGGLLIDPAAGSVALHGTPVRLTGLEFRLLAYLAHRPGQLVSKTELTEHLYAQDFDRDSNTLEVVIGRLRRKLDAALIETVRGQG